MPNMKSLSWTTKSYSPLLMTFNLEFWPQGQISPCIRSKSCPGCNFFGQKSLTMVRDTSSGGGLPTCQIWKACLERQKSYSPDTICYGLTDQFDLEVKGHQQWYATHHLEVVYLRFSYLACR
jgi:hypothetical protein